MPTSVADRRSLLAAGGMRAAGTSLVGVLLAVFLAEAGFAPTEIGSLASAGLSGAALAALLASLLADRWGRRHTLAVLALLAAAAFLGLLALPPFGVACGLAFVGMVNAMGRDRGAAAVLEQATLPETVPAERRTLAFAWYGALQDTGHALGSLLAGVPAILAVVLALSALDTARATLLLYPLLLLATIPLYLRLSPAVETAAPRRAARLSPSSRRIVWRLGALFALDGIGGGLLVTTLVSYFFFERFGAQPAQLAVLFFAARMANLLSNFGAAWLARRIGLVNTMVFTHIPSSLLLVAVAQVGSFELAAGLFLLREMLVEMDVPTRQSYAMAVVLSEERTLVSGITNMVRLGAWAVGPILAGLAMEHLSLAAPLMLGAGIKIVYDLLLYLAFRHLPPPEERV